MTRTPDPLDFEAVLEARAREALDAIIAALAEAESEEPARVVYVVPGAEIVWDETGDCRGGQLTARLSSLTAHRQSPKPAQLTPCSIDYWTANLEVTLLRCVAVVDDNGSPPAADAITRDGQRQFSDMGIMLRALTSLDFIDDVVGWTPQGPLGGMAGPQWNVTFKVDATPC